MTVVRKHKLPLKFIDLWCNNGHWSSPSDEVLSSRFCALHNTYDITEASMWNMMDFAVFYAVQLLTPRERDRERGESESTSHPSS